MIESTIEKPKLQRSVRKIWMAVRKAILLPTVLNVSLLVISIYTTIFVSQTTCPKSVVAAVAILAIGSFIRVVWLVGFGFTQAGMASVMCAVAKQRAPEDGKKGSKSVENARRLWYRRWLWWSRAGIVVSCLQLASAFCVYGMVKNNNKIPNGKRLQVFLTLLPVAGWTVVVVQWITGMDVMAWRSLYNTQDGAWRAHYQEMFDYCIREALCCLGRSRYCGRSQKDEVHSVATMLGDLVAYRAAGASHLEVLAGVALVGSQTPRRRTNEEKKLAPEALLRESSILHPYAVAAYTGPLLEIGRYPFMWPLVWLYSQGIFSFWNRWRLPVLEGDNLWRGHAAAFLRHARLPPYALQKGRVLQTNREAVYFVVVLKELGIVLVTVRGTETPEDLLTDGLGKESPLSESDLLGLLKGPGISNRVRQQVKDTVPHHAHDGIIAAARELSLQLDNLAEDEDDTMAAADMASVSDSEDEVPVGRAREGLLSELLGPKGKYKGYKLRLVGHSLGGAICALTGLRLYRRYPNLHVYAFGVLPCVDVITAQACEGFITSVVYNDEFSSRMSVASVMRLRANALKALAADTKAESTCLPKVARRGSQDQSASNMVNSSMSPSKESSLLSTDSHSNGSKDRHGNGSTDSHGYQSTDGYDNQSTDSHSNRCTARVSSESRVLGPHQIRPERRKRRRYPYMFKGGVFLCAHTCFCMLKMSRHHKATAISSEIDRAVSTRTKQQNGGNSVEMRPRCEGMCDFDVHEPGAGNSMSSTLVPPVPHALPGINEDVESKDDIRRDDWKIRRQARDREEAEENSDESTGRFPQIPNDKELQDNGIPKAMGEGFLGYEPCSATHEYWKVEMFLPGLVLHLVREEKSTPLASWKSSFWHTWRAEGTTANFHAFVVDRSEFRDFVVSPAMFIDHMPWKCQHALNSIVKQLNSTPSFLSGDVEQGGRELRIE